MEFTEVFKQAQRMCKEFQCCCSRCPISDDEGFCTVKPWVDNVDPDEAERRVMEWAKEHPEPQYPTWRDYLGFMFNIGCWKDLEAAHIPADIAKKLGVEAEGGERGWHMKK